MASEPAELPEDIDLLHVARCAVGVYRRNHYVPSSGADDLLSDACLGAVRAIASYDPTRGTTFGAWAYYRARSEMLDGVRERGPIPRWKWHTGVRDLDDLPPERKPPMSIEHEDWVQEIPDGIDRYAEIDETLDAAELLERMLEVLPDRERQVIQRRYLGEEACQIIAADLGVSAGRVSQLLKSACKRMRDAA